MKVQSAILSIFLLCLGQGVDAETLSGTRNDSIETDVKNGGFFQKTTPEFLYGYTDFNFNSLSGYNFNRYKGHSNLYSVGADHISLNSTVMAGLYYFRVDTSLAAKFSFSPTPVVSSDQTIKNSTIFGHALKILTPNIYIDAAGGYGNNQLNTYTTIGSNELNPVALFAHARNNTTNWFVSFNGIYRRIWQKLLVRANLGVLYSQIDTPDYHYLFPATNSRQKVASLTNKATLLLENAEFGYFVNPKLMPFINAGLIQVAGFSESRPIISPLTVINGTLPQLSMNRSGFRLGGGLAYSYKNIAMRVEEKYYNAGLTFTSYQTLATIEYQFS